MRICLVWSGQESAEALASTADRTSWASAHGKALQDHDGRSQLVHKAREMLVLFLNDQTDPHGSQIGLMFQGVSLKLPLRSSVCSVQSEAQRSTGWYSGFSQTSCASRNCPHEFCSHSIGALPCLRTGSLGDASWW